MNGTVLLGWCVAVAVNVLAASAQTGPLVQWGSTGGGLTTNQPLLAGPYIAIAAGTYHSLALRPDGSLVQWGATGIGQATNQPPLAGPYAAIATGAYHNLALRPDGSLVQWGDTGNGQTNNQPPLAGPYAAIAASGWFHNLALRPDGSLVQWGQTSVGQATNQPSLAGPYVAIAAGWYHNLALRPDGSLVQWGRTGEDQAINQPPLAGPYIAIAAGEFHSLALRPDGSLVQWGRTNQGQTTNQPSLAGPYIAIAAGSAHSLALRRDGSLVQWGDTSGGQATNQPPLAGPYAAIAAGVWHNLALAGPPIAPLTFTYQGVLAGEQGPVDLRFRLFTAPSAGVPVGTPHIASNITPGAGGVVTIPVTFSFADLSSLKWLEIAVAPAGSGAFTTLSPRQAMTQAPRASFADRAGVASNAMNAMNATNATNAANAARVPWSGITGVPPSVSGAFSPWVAGTGGAINYTGGSVGIGTASPTQRLSVDPGGVGGIIIGGPDPSNGSRTCLWMTVSALSGGYSTIQSISSSGNSYGNLILNPATGLVGIGTSSPSSTLSVNGSASKPGGGSWSVFSDARLKHDITPLEGSLDRLLALRGVSFIYDNPAAINELPGKRIGMVAQDVERIFPDWVQTGPSGYKSLTFRGFEALTVEAMRELKAENAALRARNADLRADHEELRAENMDIRTRLERLEVLLKRWRSEGTGSELDFEHPVGRNEDLDNGNGTRLRTRHTLTRENIR